MCKKRTCLDSAYAPPLTSALVFKKEIMNHNFYETPKSSVASTDYEESGKLNTLIIWVIGLSLISINSFSLIFAALYLLGAISPAADFVVPDTINLIDRTFVSLIYILSGIFFIKRKKLVIYAVSASIVASLAINIALIAQADIQQYIKSTGTVTIITMVFILLYSIFLNKKRILN